MLLVIIKHNHCSKSMELTTSVQEKKFLMLWKPLRKVVSTSSEGCRRRTLHRAFFQNSELTILVELQKKKDLLLSSWCLKICKYFSCTHSMFHLQPPSSPPTPRHLVSSHPLVSVSTVSGLLYCLQYFQFPLKCLAWQVVRPFPEQLQACGVSQMGLLKK